MSIGSVTSYDGTGTTTSIGLTVGATATAADAITLTAGGAIGQTQAITAGTLTTSSVGGTTLDSANQVGRFNATNGTSGDISLTNTAAPLTITGISQAVGN